MTSTTLKARILDQKPDLNRSATFLEKTTRLPFDKECLVARAAGRIASFRGRELPSLELAVQHYLTVMLLNNLEDLHPTMEDGEKITRVRIALEAKLECLIDILSSQLETMMISELYLLTGLSQDGVVEQPPLE